MTVRASEAEEIITDGDLLSYGSYIGGMNVDSQQWVYVLSARSVLDDSFASLTLKRRLDRGDLEPSAAVPGVVTGRVAVADARDIEASLAAAAAAAAEWRSAPMSVRVDEWLSLMHDTLLANQQTIEHMLTMEGHPLELARWEISGMLEACRPEAREFYRSQLWSEFQRAGQRQIVRRQPDGVVCVNPPANAPMVSALFGALSIAAGNAVVIRAPRTAPLGVMYAVHELLVPTLRAVGAPPGTINAVCGHPGPVLNAWIESPHVNDVMYFGGANLGMKFERRCVEAGKKPILELAGNDVVVVWHDAHLEHAAIALTECFFGSGQLCMIPNQAVVHPAVADELIALVVEKAKEIRSGYPDEEGVLLSPVLRHDGFQKCLADALSKGASLVSGGRALRLDGTPDPAGFFLEPTVLRVDGLATAREVEAVEHETFFPLLPIVVPEPASDTRLINSIVEFVNTNLYGLRNSVWARDHDVIDRFLTEVNNGGLLKINGSHIAFSAPLPSHGGTGLTGGAFGEANYPVLRTTRLQGVLITDADSRPRFR